MESTAVEPTKQKMEVRCAWHKNVFGCELVMREAAPGHEGDPVSHGICSDCFERVFPKRKTA